MEIKGKVHCLFEQSGTFKNEFIKLGFQAEDYDIQNNFGQTDHIVDLFSEIEKAYKEQESLFDSMNKSDLIIAFFSCIYFETIQMTYYQLTSKNNAHKPTTEKIKEAIERLNKRTQFHKLLYKLFFVAHLKGLRLILENPVTAPCYLMGQQNFPNPTFVDKDRTLRGDSFKKPTGYWFVNCTPTYGYSYQSTKHKSTILSSKQGIKAGICSEERSMISPVYARNFICDFVIGKSQQNTELTLF